MRKILDFIKNNFVKVIVIIFVLASLIVLFTNCALFENDLYSMNLTGWNIIFGLKEKTSFINPLTKEEIIQETTTLNYSILGIITISLLVLTTIFYSLDKILLKKANAYISSFFYLVLAILYLLTFMYPSFVQELQKDDYKLTLMVVVGFSIVMLAFITIIANKIYPFIKAKLKKKEN